MVGLRKAIEAAILALSPDDGAYRTLAIDAWTVARDRKEMEDRRHLRALVLFSGAQDTSSDSWLHQVDIEILFQNWPGERLCSISSEPMTSDDVANRATKTLLKALYSLPYPGACLHSGRYQIEADKGLEWLLVTSSLSLTLTE